MRTTIVFGFTALLFWLSTALRAGEPVPAEAFGKIPQVSDVELSPDGNLLAWHDESGDASRVVMFDIGASKYKRIIVLDPNFKLRELEWADNDTLLMDASAYVNAHGIRGYEMGRITAVDVAGGNERLLLTASAELLAAHTAKPKSVIMATMDYSPTSAQQELGTRLHKARADSGWVAEVYEVDTRSGAGRRIEMGTAFTDHWVLNKQGDVVARSDWDPQAQVFTILAKQGRNWHTLLRQDKQGQLVVHALTSDEKAIIVSAPNEAGREVLKALPLDGSAMRVLLEDPSSDVSSVTYDPLTHLLTGARLGGLESGFHWFDKEAERQARSVAAAFPGKRAHVYGHSENNQRVLAAVESPSSPMVFYIVDFQTHKADIVGEEYPTLANLKLGAVSEITYKARDGVNVPAYLTLPPGSTGKNLALVVLPHGGPEARDVPEFDWWPQFLASRGYAVLQPQFRGSTGFGDQWRRAGYGQWGGLMQDDVTDGVKALIDQGVADAHRVAIVGASYGGYAALAGAAFTPDMYRCAVSVNGVSDLPAMFGYVDDHAGAESDSIAYWREDIGSPFDPHVIEKSPARAAQHVTVPVLLIHSMQDSVVPIAQSELMYRALIDAGKTATLVKLPGEDHWLSRSDTRVRVLKELDAFLDANLRKAQ